MLNNPQLVEVVKNNAGELIVLFPDRTWRPMDEMPEQHWSQKFETHDEAIRAGIADGLVE